MFKYFLLIVVILSASAQASAIDSIDPKYKQILDGFLEGSNLNHLLPDLTGCGHDSVKIVDSISRSIDAFKKVPLQVDDIAFGIANIGKAIEFIGVAANKCGSIPTNFKKIIEYCSSISSDPSVYIKRLGKNALDNIMQITSLIFIINKLFEDQKFYEVGKYIGDITKIIFSFEMPKNLKFLE